MKKYFLILLLLSTSLFSQDFWQQEDKRKHLAYSAIIAGTSTAVAKHYGSSNIEAFFIGFGTAIAVGIGKEYFDSRRPLIHTEDIKDVYADLNGAVAGAMLSMAWQWKF